MDASAPRFNFIFRISPPDVAIFKAGKCPEVPPAAPLAALLDAPPGASDRV